GRVERPDDQPGTDQRAAVGEDLSDDSLACSLERTVVLGDLLGVGNRELGDGCLFRDRPAEVAVRGDARDEDVTANRIAQELRRVPDHARHVAARVDRAVPGSPLERTELAVAVAVQVLDVREELGIRATAREDRHLVTLGERGLDRVAAEELGASEHQQLHLSYRSIARPIASTPNASASAGTRSSALWMSGHRSKSSGSRSGSQPYVCTPARLRKRASVTPACRIGTGTPP